ncbi:MAG TPA: SRPBCC domain-containing protein [Candidatus Dormibacteraeota bacterium]|nr:SRPBCC domain-containing protein [Candidatus Dormibacteraeota bacterium]
MAGILSTARIDVEAPAPEVWKALTDLDTIPKYFFGSRVQTDWRPGSPITWRGQWEGKAYEDRGKVLEVEPNRLLKVSHFSPLAGLPDKPENYHNLTFELDQHGHATRVSLTQDNNKNEAEAEHATKNWRTLLEGLKKVVEAGTATA